jgi:uncharacterized OB-fold protein
MSDEIVRDEPGDAGVVGGRPPGTIVELCPDAWTEPFWTAAASHQLVCARCVPCRRFRSPPSPFCPNCQSQQIEWIELSGRGRIYSYTVVRRALTAALERSVPYVIAVVELPDAEGVRLLSNVVDMEIEDVHIGMGVAVVWDDVTSGVAVPRFGPVPRPDATARRSNKAPR